MQNLVNPSNLPADNTDLISSGDSFTGTDLLQVELQAEYTLPEIRQQVFINSEFQGLPLDTPALNAEAEQLASQGGNVAPPIGIETQIAEIEKQDLLTGLTGDAQQDAEKVQTFVEAGNLPAESPQQKLLEQYASLLPRERVVPDNTFEFLTTNIQNLNYLSKAASIMAKPFEDKLKLVKDVGEILTPYYGEAIFLDFQTALSEGNEDTAMQYLVGSHNLDKAVERYFSLEPEKQMDFLEGLLGIISNQETASGTDNTVLKLDLVSKIYDKILESPDAIGSVTATDAIAIAETTLSEIALAVPLVKIVKDTLRARRLSRILNINLNTTADRLEKPADVEGEWVGPEAPSYPNTGTAVVLDTVTRKSPEKFAGMLEGKEIKDVTDAMGVAAEDIPLRVLPSMKTTEEIPQPDGIHHQYLVNPLQRKIDNSSYAIQLQEKEIEGLLPSFVRDLDIALGDRAVPHLNQSYFEALENPTGSSLGSFVVRLGESAKGGYRTAEEASFVASRLYGENVKVVRKTPYGNFSDDLQQGMNNQGQYFIELRQEHQVTPKQGRGNFLGEEGLVTGGSFKPLLNFVLDDDYLFNNRIMDTYSSIRDRANAFGTELGKQAEPLTNLAASPQGVEDFNKVAYALESQEVDTFSATELTQILGRPPTESLVEALDAARVINAANWNIKNSAERSVLLSERYRTALIGEERFIAKPYLDKEAIEFKPAATPYVKDDKVFYVTEFRIYDPESKTSIPYTPEVVQGLYEGGGVVAKLYKNAKTQEGEFTHIIVRDAGSQIKPLQSDVTPYMKGHHQRIYKEDGFTVSVSTSKMVDGKKKNDRTVVGIAATETEARRLANYLGTQGHKIRKDSVTPTGEYVRRHGLKTAGALALEESVSRGRRLKGIHGKEFGEAEVFDPFTSYLKALSMTRLKFEQVPHDLNKQRWIDRYSSILKRNKFPADINTFALMDNTATIFKEGTSEKLIAEAANFHRLISIQEGGDMERAANWINAIIRRVERLQDEAGNVGVSKALSKVDLQKLNKLGAGYATTRFIWGQPLFQALGAVSQTPILASQGPLVFAKSAGELALEFVPLLLSKDTENFGVWAGLVASGSGKSKERVIHEMKTVLDSGIVRTAGVSQDYQTEMNDFLAYLLQNKYTRTTTAKTQKGLKLFTKVFKGTVVGSIELYELLGFFVAKNSWIKANKGKDWTEAKALKEISNEARRLTFNQNDTARFSYQNNDNLLRAAMLFMSYMNRTAVNVVDAATLGAVSKAARPKGSKVVRPYVKTKATAIAATLIGVGLYGEGYFDPLDLDFRESQKEYLRSLAEKDYLAFLDDNAKEFFKNAGIDNPSRFLVETYYRGLQTSVVNSLFEGDVDWTDKFHPASYVEAMYTKLLDAKDGNLMNTLLGIPLAAQVGLVNTVSHNAKMLMATEEVGTEEALFAALEMLSQLKIVDDAVAATLAISLERNVSKSKLTPREKTTFYEQIARLFGGIPTSSSYSMSMMDRKELLQTDYDTYTNFMVRKTQFELYNAFQNKGADLLEEEATDIISSNFRVWAQGMGDEFTQKAATDFRKAIVVSGKPVQWGDFTISREIQEQGISAFNNSLRDTPPEKWKERVLERLGILETQIEANPNALELLSEKEVLESFLRTIYNKQPEELTEEIIEDNL